jgi:hypothetical protein
MGGNGKDHDKARIERLQVRHRALAEESKLALERLKVRAELKSAGEEEPDTGRIEVEAMSRRAQQHSFPEQAAEATRTVLDGVNSWPKVVALLGLLALLAFAAWLRWG